MIKVSVVIPVFNVEKYIARCARSLFSQTLADVEFIFVDDCATDSSITLIKEVAEEFPDRDVKIISHLSNKGCHEARKTGIKAALGQYIANCDGDDWMEFDFCEKMYEEAIRSDSDMVVCGFWENDGSRRKKSEVYDDSLSCELTQSFGHSIAMRSSPNIWNKLIRRELIQDQGILFPVAYMAEDWVLTTQCIYYARKISFLGDRLYNYFISSDTLSKRPTAAACINRCMQEKANIDLITAWIQGLGLERKYKQEMISRKVIVKEHLLPFLYNSDCRKLWKSIFREINISVLFCPQVPMSYRRRHFRLLLSTLLT